MTQRNTQKNDGSWTYFANDVAYHMDKVNRNYENLVNILGADILVILNELQLQFQLYQKNKLNLIVKYAN